MVPNKKEPIEQEIILWEMKYLSTFAASIFGNTLKIGA